MDIVFKCPSCRQELEVESHAAGATIPCPSCARPLVIPQPDPTNLNLGIPAHSSAAAKEGKHFSVPVSANPVDLLIKKPSEEAAPQGAPSRGLRIKTVRHSDCREVGHDNFDQIAGQILAKIGEENIVSINTVNYSHAELGSQKIISDFGILIVYRG